MHHPTIAALAMAGFFLWRVVSRVRRLVGRQRSRLWRHRGSVLMFPVLLGLLGLGSLGDPLSMLALAVGTGAGAAIGVVGLRLTHFETAADGAYYTPYAPIGIALSALFVARLAYRTVQWIEQDLQGTGGLRALTATPLTLLVFGTLASYLTAYSIGLLRWRRRIRRPGV